MALRVYVCPGSAGVNQIPIDVHQNVGKLPREHGGKFNPQVSDHRPRSSQAMKISASSSWAAPTPLQRAAIRIPAFTNTRSRGHPASSVTHSRNRTLGALPFGKTYGETRRMRRIPSGGGQTAPRQSQQLRGASQHQFLVLNTALSTRPLSSAINPPSHPTATWHYSHASEPTPEKPSIPFTFRRASVIIGCPKY